MPTRIVADSGALRRRSAAETLELEREDAMTRTLLTLTVLLTFLVMPGCNGQEETVPDAADTTESAEDEAKTPGEKLDDLVTGVKEDAEDFAADVSETAVEASETAEDAATDLAEETVDAAEEVTGNTSDAAEEAADEAEEDAARAEDAVEDAAGEADDAASDGPKGGGRSLN